MLGSERRLSPGSASRCGLSPQVPMISVPSLTDDHREATSFG